MSEVLKEMDIAAITDGDVQKLVEAEKTINAAGGGPGKEEVYLLALKRRGR